VGPYLELLRRVRHEGIPKQDRTGVGTTSLFGWQLRFDLERGFPAVTTKKLHFRSIIHELLWFLRGETNVRALQAHHTHIDALPHGHEHCRRRDERDDGREQY